MFDSNQFGMNLKYTAQKILLADIICSHQAAVSELLRAQVSDHGQIALLTVIPNGGGKFVLLAGDEVYQAMLDIHQTDKEKTAVDCLVVVSSALTTTQRELLVAHHMAELELQSAARKLRVADLLLALADEGVMSRRGLSAIMAEMLEIEPRYAGMFLAISENAVPELRDAVTVPSSGKHKSKSAHIPVHIAARIAQQSPEMQRKLICERTEHSQTTEQRRLKTVSAWLEDLEKRINNGTLLTEEEQALLKKAQTLWRKQSRLGKK